MTLTSLDIARKDFASTSTSQETLWTLDCVLDTDDPSLVPLSLAATCDQLTVLLTPVPATSCPRQSAPDDTRPVSEEDIKYQ